MVRKATYLKYIIAGIAAVVFIIFSSFVGGGVQYVHASATSYSNVLTDLKSDESFDPAEYPENVKDVSLNVIQIGESVNNELFIYVHQPSGQRLDLKASSINIARQPGDDLKLSFKNYKLEFINSSGVFFKYKVSNFALEASDVRYYNISNILRPFDKLLDVPTGNDNTISEVKNPVGQLWTVTTIDGETTYTMTTSEVIEITEKYVGYVYYDDGTELGWGVTSGATAAHFVAFSTDKPIDKLISVDISFSEQNISCKLCNNVAHLTHTQGKYFDYVPGEKHEHEPNPLTIKYTEKGSNQGGDGIRPANKYTWNRIRSTAEFLADENNQDNYLTSDGLNNISGTEWVLNFYETPIKYQSDNVWLPVIRPELILFTGDVDCQFTQVSDVMLLRLEFETDGETFNLGVVDNKQTGGSQPVNAPNASGCAGSWEWLNVLPWWAWVLIVFGIILTITVLILLSLARARAPKVTIHNEAPKTRHSTGATGKRKRKTTKKKGGKK